MTSRSFAMNRANCNLKFDITNSKTVNACLRMCVYVCRFSLCVYSSLAIKGKDRSLTLMLCRRTRCGCYQVEVRFTVANLSALKVEIVSGSWGTTNQPDAAAVAPGAAAPVAVAVACHTFHFAHFHHFRFSISLWQTIWRSRCRPIGVCNKKLSLLPFCIQNACNKQNAFTCAQLSTLMQRNKPPGCRDSSTTGCQYGRMPCPCLHSLSPMPNPLRAIYSIISFSYSYFPAAATDVAAAAVASVWCTALAF